jgi:hypothetical protein
MGIIFARSVDFGFLPSKFDGDGEFQSFVGDAGALLCKLTLNPRFL